MSAPWSAPGETAAQPVSAPAPIGEPPIDGAQPGPRHDDRSPLPPPPLPLRPMTIPDLLDGAFAIMKQRPRDVLTLAVAFIVPIEVLSALLLRDVLGGSGIFASGGSASIDTADSGPLSGVGPLVVSGAISVASLALLAGALAHLVAAWYDGDDVTPGAAILVALRRSPALLVAVVVVHVLELVGLLGFLVGGYVVMALLHVVSPIIVVERLGPFRAIARSMRLTATRFGSSLAVPGLVGLIGILIGFGFEAIPEVAVVVTPDDWDWLVRAVGQTTSQLVIAPFTAGVAVLYHLDLRIRAEGYDIERRTHVVFAR